MEANQWGDTQAIVAGGLLGLYEYEELKQKKKLLYLLSYSEVGSAGLAESREESCLLLGRTWPPT